ncbi:alpha/beta fold hydrolase [Paracoccus sp. PARArs4]|uniref:alpha/beta fold hydrolase n=1 Tax=Paracoccus sp. PARArs4 TaxID=2853442 RepID=UPI0024A70D84|nr:alpha/beta fold hydrolase [Paracoccus sp. PARArs4]
MKLNHTTIGPQDGLPVLLVHGLYGQGRNLGAQARRLAETRPVTTVDLRNHGDSPHDPDASYAALAGDLAAMIDDLGGKVDLVGHSMGGKASMLLALTHPQMVRRLAVMDIAPIAYGHDQTRYVDAMERMEIAHLTRRAEADRAMTELVPERGVRAFLLQNLDLKADPVRWRLNLKALRDHMPQIVGWPEDAPRGTFDGKVLEIKGELSSYVTDEGEAALRAHFPQARTVTIKGASHWLHADAPDAVAETLAVFLGDGRDA